MPRMFLYIFVGRWWLPADTTDLIDTAKWYIINCVPLCFKLQYIIYLYIILQRRARGEWVLKTDTVYTYGGGVGVAKGTGGGWGCTLPLTHSLTVCLWWRALTAVTLLCDNAAFSREMSKLLYAYTTQTHTHTLVSLSAVCGHCAHGGGQQHS